MLAQRNVKLDEALHSPLRLLFGPQPKLALADMDKGTTAPARRCCGAVILGVA